MTIFGPLSYLLAAALFFMLSVLVLTAWRGGIQGGLLLLASIISMTWAGVLAWQALTGRFQLAFLFSIEVARDAAWLAFLLSVLQSAGRDAAPLGLRLAVYIVPAGVFLLGISAVGPIDGPGQVLIPGGLVLALIGLVIVERIYRSAEPNSRRSIAYLSLACGGIFIYDMFLFSSALLVNQIDPGIWAARGIANSLIVPFLVVAARRNPDWPVAMFVSRQAVFFSATLFGAGTYLLLMAIAGYYLKLYGGDWGTAAQAIFFFGALILLALILLSDRIRRQVRVFLSKHFYQNRYDYREEWLRLSHTLYSPEITRPLAERCIQAAAQILDSETGILLLRPADSTAFMSPVAAWRRSLPEGIRASADDDFATYLQSQKWVVDTAQYHDDPEFYQGLHLPSWLADKDTQYIVVPLLLEEELIGMLVLEQGKPRINLTYEDTDLLKIVGHQEAGNLMQQQASERLSEGKQFQAYSRLTAFLMHDLKNLIAQQSLVVKNAARHKGNPEFIDDAIDTIANSVARMNRLITQLKEREREESREEIDLSTLLVSVASDVSDRSPKPDLNGMSERMTVSADKDRLTAVFSNLLRNAQDACKERGEITLSVCRSDQMAKIEVQDTGCGMDEQFIRGRLFRPFESTKGSDGMGIGAYQVREYVNSLNGQLQIESKPGFGTCVTVLLPRLTVTGVGRQ